MRPLAAVLFVLATVTVTAEDAITCTGLWSPSLTEAALVKKYGREQVQREMIYAAEGQELPGTVLYPDDEAARVEIVWRDARKRRNPEWVRVAGTRWLVPGGFRLNTPLADIEKLNGRPFQLSGFDWDYGGMVLNWRDGALAKLNVPCRVQVRFDRTVPDDPTGPQQRAIDATSGDRELLSSSADLRKLDVRVSEVILQYD